MALIQKREEWNKGKLVGQKLPLKPKDIWAIRINLKNTHAARDLAMFNLAIDSKLRVCHLVNLHVRDVAHGKPILPRALVIQQKTEPSGEVRTNGTDTGSFSRPDRENPPAERSVSVSELHRNIAARADASIRTDRASLNPSSRAGFIGLRDALDAPHHRNFDVQADEEPRGSSAFTWPYETGKYVPIPKYRSG